MPSTSELEFHRRHMLAMLGAQLGLPNLASATETAATANRPASPALPFDMPPAASLNATGRKVYSQWHVFPISLDDKFAADDLYTTQFCSPQGFDGRFKPFGGYLGDRPLPRRPIQTANWQIEDMIQDIQWANDIGIDGFIFNIVTAELDSVHWAHLPRMLQAAERLSEPFEIIPSLDASSDLQKQSNSEIVSALATIAPHPRLKRTDGRIVLASFKPESWKPDRWRDLFARLSQASIAISFFPIYLDPDVADSFAFPPLELSSRWSGNNLLSMRDLRARIATAHRSRGRWASPVWPQDCRQKDGVYWEAANSAVFREGWTTAIEGGADAVILNTWNDYSESSHIRPSEKIGFSFHDLAAYYVVWFKTGKPPTICRDVLFYFHRSQRAEDLGSLGAVAFKKMDWSPRRNAVELVACLARPGTLAIEVAGNVISRQSVEGLTCLSAPLNTGRPRFRLFRDGKTVIDIESQALIDSPGPYQDLIYHGGRS